MAVDYQCEVIDINAKGSTIIFSEWDGWSLNYGFYGADVVYMISKSIIDDKKEEKSNTQVQFTLEELKILSNGILILIKNAGMAKGLIYKQSIQKSFDEEINRLVKLNDKICEYMEE